MAPLDIKFIPNGTTAYVSFHGSWDRSPPSGYKVSTVTFDAAAGEPVERPDSQRGLALDVLANPNGAAACPAGCFRPAGLVLDSSGRVWVSSDATGEIYVLEASGNGTFIV